MKKILLTLTLIFALCLNQYRLNAGMIESISSDIRLNALSACLYDCLGQRFLYEKNADEKRAVASTTKIMTLILVLELGNLDDIVTFSQNASKQPDVQMNGCTGERYVLRDLCYAMMLESYNDVAVAIAEHIGGSCEKFAELMNEKAKTLGCYDTHFVTPNGLDREDKEGEHLSTAKDMAKIASYAIQNEKFCEIIRTNNYSFSEIDGKRKVSVCNRDAFLTMYEGAIGVKTGFTGKAGYCFVGAVKKDGATLVAVVLGSGWPPKKTLKWSDTKMLMDYGFEEFKVTELFEGFYIMLSECENVSFVHKRSDGTVYMYIDGRVVREIKLQNDEQ